jgi:capsular exopolysaccharide synthesis family protein
MPQDPLDSGYEDTAYPDGRPTYRATSQETPMTAMILALLKRPWITVVCLFVIVIPALFYFYSLRPLYSSSSFITTIQPPTPSDMGALNLQPLVKPEDDDLFYAAILESNTFYQNVTERLIKRQPELASSPDSVYNLVRNYVSYSRKARTTGFLVISAIGLSPENAQLLSNDALDAFTQISIELRRQNTTKAANFIESQLTELNHNLGDVEAQIQSFLTDHKLNLDDVSSGIDSELRELEKNLGASQAQRDIAKLQINSFTTQVNERVSSFLDRSTNPVESEKLLSLRSRLQQINAINTDSLGKVDSVAFNRLQGEKLRILSDILKSTAPATTDGNRNNFEGHIALKTIDEALDQQFLAYETAQNQCNYYEGQIDLFHRNHPDLPSDILEFLNISRTKEVLQRNLDALVDMRENKRIEMAAETGGIIVIDKPNLGKPINQKRLPKLLIALFASIFLGAGISYLIDHLDNTVQGEVDIQKRFNLAVYGSVPVLDLRTGQHRRKKTHGSRTGWLNADTNDESNLKLLDHHTESSPIAEAYRAIKTGILFTGRDKGRNVFIVSSPVASDGKSLTTYNLGVSAAQGGTKVLIIDADLRRSSQHKLFGVSRMPGLTEILHGEIKTSEAVVAGRTPNLFLLPAGSRAANPAELVSSHLMRELIEEESQKYDLVLIDTPPITPCMDSRQLALMVGGMILVVRAEGTKLNVLEHGLNLCRRVGAEIYGVVVNHATFRYGFGYYYLYQRYNAYGYYYSGYQYYYSQDPETGEKSRKKRRGTSKVGAA